MSEQEIAFLATILGGIAALWFFWDKLILFFKRTYRKYRRYLDNKPPRCLVELERPEGQVPLDSPFYVERPPIEDDCYQYIVKPNALIRVKAPRQLGKSSLMVRILAHAKSEGHQTVSLSLQLVDSPALENLDTFLRWLCTRVTHELDLPKEQVAEHWSDLYGSMDNCTDYFAKYLLTEALTIGLDEVDRVFQYEAIAQDFFGLLRAWHERGKNNATWQKLRLVITHSQEVYIPLNINQSPFNVGMGVELPELTQKQIHDLVKRHGLQWTEEHVSQLKNMVGGHPYLVRVALYTMAQQRTTLADFLKLAPTAQGLYHDHLRRHLENLKKHPELASAMKQAVLGNTPVKIGDTEAFKLRSMGLVKFCKDEVTPLCDLYRQFFITRL
jgi:hypothetical protein